MNNLFLRHACYIDGAWVGASSQPRIPVVDPATGREIASVPMLGRADAEAAIAAAYRALAPWAALPAAERCAHLSRLHALLLEHQEPLARLLSAEQGKPLAEARAEIAYSASYVDWYAAEGRRVYGETIPAGRADQRITVIRQPIGVCGAITPWNFPSAMLARKLAPALAAGCTLVCKPAEETPLSGLAWGVLCERAEIPAGVINVITGEPAEIGAAMMQSPRVRKVSFTGSTEVGKLLIRASADTVTKLSLELGGNAPFLVFGDADLERAVAGAMASKYRASGQTCVCANRFLVERSIEAAFTEAMIGASCALAVGPGSEPGVDLGPLINRDAAAKAHRLVTEALEAGATLRTGKVPDPEELFCAPVVLGDVTNQMSIAREEIFAPVVAIQSFDTEAEAIAIANDTDAGLAAYVYTRDAARIVRVAEALDFGMVGVNEGLISAAQVPFGGIKESGYGREGGRHGIDEYLRLKYICTTL